MRYLTYEQNYRYPARVELQQSSATDSSYSTADLHLDIPISDLEQKVERRLCASSYQTPRLERFASYLWQSPSRGHRRLSLRPTPPQEVQHLLLGSQFGACLLKLRVQQAWFDWFLASPVLGTLTWYLQVSALQALTSEKLRFACRYSSNAGSRYCSCSGVNAICVLESRVARGVLR